MTNDPYTPASFNPFPGLRAFEEEEEHLFFGREKQVTELLAKLAHHRFLAVIGTSGSGKSSLVKSGLLPSLFRGFLAGAGTSWNIAVMRPGSDPIGNLAAAAGSLSHLEDVEDSGEAIMLMTEAALRHSRLGLADTVHDALRGRNENVLIVVDQFEELFRFSRYEKESNQGERDALAFVNLLLEAAQRPGLQLYVAITMRSDFLGNCTEFRGLPEAINQGLYLIPRMTREEIRSAITGPVAVGGGTITPMLVSRLLNDVGDNPDQLPILQHALMRTWQAHQKEKLPGTPLDVKHYEAIGTMKHGLSQHAEEAYAELATEKEKQLCETIFRSLTEKRPDMPGTRRPTSVGDLAAIAGATEADVIKVIDVFRSPGRSFLLPPSTAPLTSGSIIDISHESLMRVWDRLVKWVEEEADSAAIYLRLVLAASVYEKGQRSLYRSPELDFALRWRETHKPTPAWGNKFNAAFSDAMGFLEKSGQARIAREQEQQRRKKRRRNKRIIIVAVVFVLFCGLSAGVMAFFDAGVRHETERIVQSITNARILSLKASHLAEDADRPDRMLQACTMAIESYEMFSGIRPGAEDHPDVVNFLALDKIFWKMKEGKFNLTEKDDILAMADLDDTGRAVFITHRRLYKIGMDTVKGLNTVYTSLDTTHNYSLVAASRFDGHIAVGSRDGWVTLFSKSLDSLTAFRLHTDGPTEGLGFTGPGILTLIRSVPDSSIIVQYDVAARRVKSRLGVSVKGSAHVLFSESLMIHDKSGRIEIYTHEGKLIKTITGVNEKITAMCVSPDNNWISWGTENGSVYLNEVHSPSVTGRMLKRLGHSSSISSLEMYMETTATKEGPKRLPYLASAGTDAQVIIVEMNDELSEQPRDEPLIIISDLPNVSEMLYNTGANMLILKDGGRICAHIINLRLLVREVRAIRDSLKEVVKTPR